MARKLGVEYEETIYHLLNRGNRKEPTSRDDADRWRFLEALGLRCWKKRNAQ